MNMQQIKRQGFKSLILMSIFSIALLGCPLELDQVQYDLGWTAGFQDDTVYWTGFWHGWDSLDEGFSLYDATPYPELLDPPYEAGFNDGQFYAYNDGYYVAYTYAFVIGFSEGYDATFAEDAADFLSGDYHAPDYLNGGFSDGFHDGFSEGRIYGAFDYFADYPFDWMDALMHYFFDEVDGTLCFDTGTEEICVDDLGPVEFYIWGTNTGSYPDTKASGNRLKKGGLEKGASWIGDLLMIDYRPLPSDVIDELDSYAPTYSERGMTDLLLTSSWYERVDDFVYEIGGYDMKSLKKESITFRSRK